jgi:antitoxin CcdA
MKTPTMVVSHLSTRKRPVNLTLNEVLVERARRYTDNLSATLESLLTEYVARQEREQALREQAAQRCCQDWNALHDRIGSFANEHQTL